MSYDLVVIGTGPGGYVCAIRAAQLGLKTAVVEKRRTHGGHGHFAEMGIEVGAPKLDLSRMMGFKQEGVDGNVKGVEYLLKKNKVDAVFGTARIAAPGQVEVRSEDGSNQVLETKAIVIATGSEVTRLPGVAIDEMVVVSSTGALELERVPRRLVVIGAGAAVPSAKVTVRGTRSSSRNPSSGISAFGEADIWTGVASRSRICIASSTVVAGIGSARSELPSTSVRVRA